MTVTPEPSNEGGSVTASANLTDPGADTFTCTVDYGAGPLPGMIASNTCTSLSQTYADDGDAATELGRGSIVIHKGK